MALPNITTDQVLRTAIREMKAAEDAGDAIGVQAARGKYDDRYGQILERGRDFGKPGKTPYDILFNPRGFLL